MEHVITLGGKQYALRYTVNSVCALEEMFGMALHQLLMTDVSSVRALLWCGLLHTRQNQVLDVVGCMLDEALASGDALSDIGAVCAKALKDAGFFRAARRQEAGRSRCGSNTCV